MVLFNDATSLSARFPIRVGQSPIDVASLSELRFTRQLGYSLDLPVEVLSRQAWAFYHMGYFSEGLDLCCEIARRGEASQAQRSIWFLNKICFEGYRCDSHSLLHDPNPNVDFMVEGFDSNGIPSIQFHSGPTGLNASPSAALTMRSSLYEDVRSQYPLESLLLTLIDENMTCKEQAAEVQKVLEQLENNLWIVPADHPTAALSVAKWCVDQQAYLDFARAIVNCCIGWRYTFRSIDDLASLARLLYFFSAPRIIWTSLLGRYLDFAYDDSIKQEAMFGSGLNPHLIKLRRAVVNAKEGLFHRFCADHGVPQYDKLMDLVMKSLRIDVDEDAKQFRGEGKHIAGPCEQWMTADAFQMRHPWFCLLLPHEQDFVRNGDTAFATCITSDFSFGCAQWWRCVESVLRRRLVGPLGDLVDANPTWVTDDKICASQRSDEWDWEAIFVRILPDARRRQQLSLTQMLILLEMCLSDLTKKRQSISTVRRKCVEYVGSKLPEFLWVVGELDEVADFRSMVTPRILNEETIAAFRNSASHDAPMDFETAAAGRLLAIRILEFMHYPRYCVTTKLEQLKQELSAKRGQPEL